MQIARDVKARLDEIQQKLPPGISIANWYDQSELVTASAASRARRHADRRGAGCARSVAVPAKLESDADRRCSSSRRRCSATIVLLYALHMSFNIMTLGGMAAAVGLIIDDAIVMIEHIIRRMPAAPARIGERRHWLRRRSSRRPLAGSSAVDDRHLLAAGVPHRRDGGVFQGPLSLTDGVEPDHLVPGRLARRAACWPSAPADRKRTRDQKECGALSRMGLHALRRSLMRPAGAAVDCRASSACYRCWLWVRCLQAGRLGLHAGDGRRRLHPRLPQSARNLAVRDGPPAPAGRGHSARHARGEDVVAPHRPQSRRRPHRAEPR